jgi:hypothetical protein
MARRKVRSKGSKLLKLATATEPTPVQRAYADAVSRSRETRKPVRFLVDILPDGSEKIIPVERPTATPAQQRQAAPDGSALGRALAAARHRGRLRVAEVLAGAEMLSADQLAERLGTTRATVTAWRHKHQVLGLEGATRGFRFPDWQIGDNGKPFSAIPEIFDRLGGDAWAVYRFLVQWHPELGMTAKEALQRGNTGEVIEAAESAARAFS